MKHREMKTWHLAALGGLVNLYIPYNLIKLTSGTCEGGCDMLAYGPMMIILSLVFVSVIFLPSIFMGFKKTTHFGVILGAIFGIMEISISIKLILSGVTIYYPIFLSGLILIASALRYYSNEFEND